MREKAEMCDASGDGRSQRANQRTGDGRYLLSYGRGYSALCGASSGDSCAERWMQSDYESPAWWER